MSDTLRTETNSAKLSLMTYPLDILPVCDSIDPDWDTQDIRDLILTTPLQFDDDGLPVGYATDQLFGMGAAQLGRYL